MLESILTYTTTGAITTESFLWCTLASLILGAAAALVYMFKNNYTKSFVVTLALLPAMVQIVIMMVNGNLGAGVAVMGAFSLIRFRSVAGNAREIGAVFLTMSLGLATGMGYVGFAAIFLVVISAVNVLYNVTSFGESKNNVRELRVTIPENLDYNGVFDDLFAKYTQKHELIRVKTTNMGSLFDLHYEITLKDSSAEKSFIDELRERNGNLTISCGKPSSERSEL